MATSQNRSFLKYTGLTYADILKQITDKLKADKRFDNFRESAIAQTMIEIFAGTADLVNYYIERQAEESFFETAQRKSSSILNSRNLAYDITRPIPASANITINIKGDMQGKIVAGRKIQMPVFSKFSYQGTNFILKKGFTYTFTQTDAQNVITDGEDFEMDITTDDDGDPITLIEGVIKTKIIDGAQNPQVGQIFQSYVIEDSTFSNYYGSGDLEDYPTTRVWVGDAQTTENEYYIDRRSLINDITIADISTNLSATQKCCVIRTAVDENAELRFGSAKIATTGAVVESSPSTTFDNIYVQYLSTVGAKSNLIGVIGETLVYSSPILVSVFNITDSVKFLFETNIVGGGDLESSDSIKANAPGIFYSLDRAVDNQDHVNILKALTSPIVVRNAIAWGEQEEARARGVVAIVELFNVGFFTCVGSLYITDGDITTATYSVRTKNNRLDESVLDNNFDEDAMGSQYYFNIFVKTNVAQQIKEQVISTYFWEIADYQPVSKTAFQLKTDYSADYTVEYQYMSDTNLADVSATDSITLNFSAISTDPLTGMTDIATQMQTALRANLDTRSQIVDAVEQNPNFNLPQFPGITVTWDDDDKKFTIANAVDDACYLNFVVSDGVPIVQDLGMHASSGVNDPATANKKGENINGNYVSEKTIQVIDYMTKRGQITMKYLYASPIMQSFRLTGTVYIEQLFSVDDLHREINNAIYKFLDNKTDFNIPVYLSNIIDIIENFEGVDHADVKFLPDIPYPTANPLFKKTFFFPYASYYPTINGDYDTRNTIYFILFDILNSYLLVDFTLGTDVIGYVEDGTEEEKWRTFIEMVRGFTPDEIHTYKGDPAYPEETAYLSVITERFFLTTIVKEIYDSLVTGLGPSTDSETMFQDTQDFIDLVSDLHKDLSWIIRCNMIDANGNIAPEYKTTENDFGIDSKELIRGGFTLGCEIPKINLESTDPVLKVPYLNYLYK